MKKLLFVFAFALLAIPTMMNTQSESQNNDQAMIVTPKYHDPGVGL